MDVFISMLAVLALSAGYTDLRHRKIPNWLAVSGFCGGLLGHLWADGFSGLSRSLLGAFLGFGVMLLLYMCKAVGAGDVKLFAAIGAISGPMLTFSAITYSVLWAGVIGIGILLHQRRLFASGKSIGLAVAGFLFIRQKLCVDERLTLRFPFMAAVIPGLCTALWEMGSRGVPVWMP
jgi:prepilin peptidase CpaA